MPKLFKDHGLTIVLLLLFAAMARHPALAARLPRFLARPLVGRALLMRGLATLARNLALLVAVHRREPAILFRHRCPPRVHQFRSAREYSGCNRCATNKR